MRKDVPAVAIRLASDDIFDDLRQCIARSLPGVDDANFSGVPLKKPNDRVIPAASAADIPGGMDIERGLIGNVRDPSLCMRDGELSRIVRALYRYLECLVRSRRKFTADIIALLRFFSLVPAHLRIGENRYVPTALEKKPVRPECRKVFARLGQDRTTVVNGVLRLVVPWKKEQPIIKRREARMIIFSGALYHIGEISRAPLRRTLYENAPGFRYGIECAGTDLPGSIGRMRRDAGVFGYVQVVDRASTKRRIDLDTRIIDRECQL